MSSEHPYYFMFLSIHYKHIIICLFLLIRKNKKRNQTNYMQDLYLKLFTIVSYIKANLCSCHMGNYRIETSKKLYFLIFRLFLF